MKIWQVTKSTNTFDFDASDVYDLAHTPHLSFSTEQLAKIHVDNEIKKFVGRDKKLCVERYGNETSVFDGPQPETPTDRDPICLLALQIHEVIVN